MSEILLNQGNFINPTSMKAPPQYFQLKKPMRHPALAFLIKFTCNRVAID